MPYLLKYVLHVLVLPPACLIVLGLAGLVLMRRRPRLGGTLIAAALLLLWVLSMPYVGARLLRHVETDAALDLSRPVAGGAVVILGGGARCCAAEYDGGPAPGPVTLERVAYGAYVARRLNLPVLVTGAPVEAEGMRAMLQRVFAIDARWVDAGATDTAGNASRSATLLARDGITAVVLVTSASHERRAVHEFEDAGLQVTPAPTNLEPPPTGLLERPPLGLLPSVAGFDRSETALREIVGEQMRPLLRSLRGARARS